MNAHAMPKIRGGETVTSRFGEREFATWAEHNRDESSFLCRVLLASTLSIDGVFRDEIAAIRVVPSVVTSAAFVGIDCTIIVVSQSLNANVVSSAVSAALDQIYALEMLAEPRAASRLLMGWIEGNNKTGDFGGANDMLMNADLRRFSSRSLMGLIRSTYRMREMLPAWSKTYYSAWVEVDKKGKKPQDIFIGLPPPDAHLRVG